MGILPASNHLALLGACYPQKSYATPLSELKPDSNSLSKLCFYAAGRPKKLPKVAAALVERAERLSRSSGGPKPRAELAVTLDIVRQLVIECHAELQCFAEQALKVAELALGRREGGKRDVEIEARASGLFHAVSVYLSGPFMGLDEALAKQYMRCLSLISSTAQLGGDNARSRWVALKALEGAATSDLLYSASSDYDAQIHEIVPALLYNCAAQEVPQLVDQFANSASMATLPPSRSSPPIVAPRSSPTVDELAGRAVHIFRQIIHRSHAVQLSAKLSAACAWLDSYGDGKLWNDADFVLWIGESGISASAVQYRAIVLGWWADQVADIKDDYKNDSPKPRTLIHTLSSLLRGPTSLVGLATGSVLSQLTSLLLRRIATSDVDALTPELLSAIAALASRIYYFDQLNDVVSDLIDTIRAVRSGSGVAAGMNENQRTRALRILVAALQGVLEEAKRGNAEVQFAVPLQRSASSRSAAKGSNPENGQSLQKANGASAPVQPRPALHVTETVRGDGVLLGSGQGLRSKKEANGGTKASLDPTGRIIMDVVGSGRRHRVSAEAFQASLFLLSQPDAELRADYEKALLLFVADEMDVAVSENGEGGSGEQQNDPWKDSTRFFNELHATIYELAISFLSSSLHSPTPLRSSPAKSRKDPRSRQSSTTSHRRSPSPTAEIPIATANDYESLAEIVAAAQTRSSSLAVLSGVPMFLSLEHEATKAASKLAENATNDSLTTNRVRDCRKIVSSGLAALSVAWKVAVPPPPESFSPDWMARVVDVLSASQDLQGASGLDKITLSATLSIPWTPDVARTRANPPGIYRDAGSKSRSVTNLSTPRVNRTPDRARSFQTPSVADLQISLGRSGSLNGSAAPSIASTSGTVQTYDRRRTSKTTAAGVLAGLTARSRTGSRISIVDRGSSGLSVAPSMAAS